MIHQSTLARQTLSQFWKILGIFAAHVLLIASGVAVVWHFAAYNGDQAASVHVLWETSDLKGLFRHLTTWDAAHYLTLSHNGYHSNSPSCAFYPLWPALINLSSSFLCVNETAASLLIANLLSGAAFFFFYEIVRTKLSHTIALRAVLLLAFFPGSLFLALPYSESLFLFLILLFFIGLDRCTFWLCAISSFLLPLCRPVGIFILATVLYVAFVNTSEKPNDLERWPSLKLLPLFPITGLAIYFAIMFLSTGNALEGFAAQSAYLADASPRKILDLPGLWTTFTNVQSPFGMENAVFDRVLFVIFLLSLPLTYRLSREWFWFALPAGVVPALTNSFISYRRYVVIVFPFFVVLALLLRRGPTWMFWYFLAISALLQFVLVCLYSSFNWAG